MAARPAEGPVRRIPVRFPQTLIRGLSRRDLTDIIDSGVCHQAIFLGPAGNSLGLHHRYAPEP
jgi:hypothetical protein